MNRRQNVAIIAGVSAGLMQGVGIATQMRQIVETQTVRLSARQQAIADRRALDAPVIAAASQKKAGKQLKKELDRQRTLAQQQKRRHGS